MIIVVESVGLWKIRGEWLFIEVLVEYLGEFVKIDFLNFVCSVLLLYWRCNKILLVVFKVVVFGDILDGVFVMIVVGNDENFVVEFWNVIVVMKN